MEKLKTLRDTELGRPHDYDDLRREAMRWIGELDKFQGHGVLQEADPKPDYQLDVLGFVNEGYTAHEVIAFIRYFFNLRDSGGVTEEILTKPQILASAILEKEEYGILCPSTFEQLKKLKDEKDRE